MNQGITAIDKTRYDQIRSEKVEITAIDKLILFNISFI